MDEIKKFLGILKRHLMSLIIVPIIAVIITFFLVRNIPNSYISQAEIATGIVDETQRYQQRSLTNLGMLQNEQVNQEFSNLITMMRMKKMLDQISYKLILHDLTTGKPFRSPSREIKDLNSNAKAHAIDVYKEMYSKRQSLNLWDDDQNGIHRVLTSMGYDSESLADKLVIFRSGSSDFITIQFESEDPTLSAMVVNTLAAEFISYYSSIVRTNKIKATNFLSTLLKEKSDTLANRMAELRTYKIKNRVLNLDEQSSQLYTSIVEYEAKKQEAVQNTSSYAGALNEIDRKFSPNERKYLEATLSKVNQNILQIKTELTDLYGVYYKSDFEEKYKTSIDSLQRKLSSEVSKSSDQYLTNPLATKEALVTQKLDLEVKLDISRYSINALEREINRLNNQFEQLVPREAEVQSYEMSIDIASKEYLDILDKYNQSSMESELPVKLNIVQPGMPGLAQPSKKMLLVILSAIISFFFVLLVLFVLFLFDNRVLSKEQLANKTGLDVVGEINSIDISSLELKNIWTHESQPTQVLNFKNQLRAIRYEIENGMKGRVLTVTSLISSQGKTFLTLNLAFAWLVTNRRVLIIDGNFSNPKIGIEGNSTGLIEDFLLGNDDAIHSNSPLVILRNGNQKDTSLAEIATDSQIRQQLKKAMDLFDLIVIETSSLDVGNNAKEWISFSNEVIAPFNCGTALKSEQRDNISYLKESGMFLGWVLNKMPN